MNWYLNYDGKQLGPMDEVQAKGYAQSNTKGLAWREGMPEWVPIASVAELVSGGVPPVAPTQSPPAMSDVIGYQIIGSEMQFVEVELDPGKSVVAEAGVFMYKDTVVQMDTIMGDGSAQSSQGGLLGKVLSAGKRALTGAGLFITVFSNRGSGKAKAAFAAPYPGNIIPVHLPDVGGTLICQKDAFLCAAKGVAIDIFFQRKILSGLFGGDGFIMQRLVGDGMVFMHAGGTIVQRELQAGETVHVEHGCVVAFQPSVQFDITQAGNIKSALLGGDGFFFAVLQGPGKVWMQSLPFSRLAARMMASAPARGGGSRGDIGGDIGTAVVGGAVLEGIGSFFGSDDS